jgi:hypothetical protein
MAQFGIISFHRIGVGLTLRNCVTPWIIAQLVVDRKCIAVVHSRAWPLIDDLLHVRSIPLPDHITANKAARAPIYFGDDVDLLFLSPIKVNSSSSSAVSTSGGVGTWVIPLAYACTQSETVR